MFKQAEYIKAKGIKYQGNPLIEALPPQRTDQELSILMRVVPEYSEDERNDHPVDKLEHLSKLREFIQPLEMYLDCYRAIALAIKTGYAGKNPLLPSTMNFLYYSSDNPSLYRPKNDIPLSGRGMTIVGEGGVGKTTMIFQILNCFDQIIEHKKYENRDLNLKQVVWLKVDCPPDGSRKQLCTAILNEFDRILGQTTKHQKTIYELVDQIKLRIKTSFLGILVVDEMQYIKAAKSGGADLLINFLQDLINNLGITICFCGNYEFKQYIQSSFRIARRSENSGYFEMKSLDRDDEMWDIFVEELWGFQWIKTRTLVTKSLSDKLHEVSLGNIDVAVRTYGKAQEIIIKNDDEMAINESIIEMAATLATPLSGITLAEQKVAKKDLSIFRRQPILPGSISQKESIKIKSKDQTGDNKFYIIPGDLSRPVHPEFGSFLLALIRCEDLHERIKDPDLIQRASESESVIDFLRDHHLLCESPLKRFG